MKASRRVRPARWGAALAGAALLASAVLTLPSCRHRSDWVMFRGEQGRGYTPTALSPPLAVKWKLQLQVGAEPTYAFNNPVVVGNTIYFGSTDGNFYALDIDSGYMRWVFKTHGAINSIPFADGRNIYFGNNVGEVHAVSQETGEQSWSFQTDSTVQSSIVGYEDYLIFASDGGTSYFLSPDGRQRFTLPNPAWHYNTFQVFDDVLYFAPGPPSQPHAFGAFDLNERAYLWILDTSRFDAVWYSFPALKGDLLYFSTATPFGEYWGLDYYAFRRRTGEIVWHNGDLSDWGGMSRVNPDALFDSDLRRLDYLAPALWRNLVIYCSGDTLVRAFQSRSGARAWTRSFDQPTSSAPTVAGDRVYFGLEAAAEGGASGAQGRLVCLAARNGRLLWDMEVEGALLSAPVIAGRWLIFGTDRNCFYVLEEVY
jgi:outer membrane protein assembly factor BamB